MLDYKLLEALSQVVGQGGFEKAAQALGLTQSAVSQRVRQLEESYGAVLITRSNPPKPTPAGAKLISHFWQVSLLEADLEPENTPDRARRLMPIAVNADSLELWLLPALQGFLDKDMALVEVRVDDQDETIGMLKKGEVVGSISSYDQPVQGCHHYHLGTMVYRLMSTPGFARRYFPDGITPESLQHAPLVIFNRKDNLQHKSLESVLGFRPERLVAHYIPSTISFAQFICMGQACGMLPEQQGLPLQERGELVDLVPNKPTRVELYWHSWSLPSDVLKDLGEHIIKGAAEFLAS